MKAKLYGWMADLILTVVPRERLARSVNLSALTLWLVIASGVWSADAMRRLIAG